MGFIVMLHRIDEQDNVAVALDEIKKQDAVTCCNNTFIAKDDIPRGHKMAIKDIAKGNPVIKYGNQIGLASSQIDSGNWVHTHNVASQADEHRKYIYQYDKSAILPHQSDKTFMGYYRNQFLIITKQCAVVILTVAV